MIPKLEELTAIKLVRENLDRQIEDDYHLVINEINYETDKHLKVQINGHIVYGEQSTNITMTFKLDYWNTVLNKFKFEESWSKVGLEDIC